jgi:hypothetical protein
MADKVKAAFIAGWMQAVGSSELDKTKLSQVAAAAADKYIAGQSNAKVADEDQQGIDFYPNEKK